MSDEPIAWLRDIDGTGSMHVCSKGDSGAIEAFSQPSRYTDKDAEIARLREALEPFVALANEVFERYEKSPGVYREAYDDYPNDRALWGFNDATITYGHLRTARAALEPKP